MLPMIVTKEIQARTVLSPSRVYDYSLNPYVGCVHGCRYCYAQFMKRYRAHAEPWGQFVDAKTNAPEILSRELMRKRMGRVWISGVCDPYQWPEKTYMITRQCLEILVKADWPISIQTKSNLVLRDRDIIVQGKGIEVGVTITTADTCITKIFEPRAPTVEERLATLASLHAWGVKTFAMITPLLPGSDRLVSS